MDQNSQNVKWINNSRTAWGRVFSSKFLMGGDSKFLVPVGPRWGRSQMGGTCEKNPTEAKSVHVMQN